jgi:predicted RNA-binding protein with PUA-like domain
MATGTKNPVRFWLMKSEPDVFSFDDLVSSPKKTAPWEGVRNYQARNIMRDEMPVGQQVFFYHSSCKEPGIYGIAEVVKLAYPDHTALDPKNEYFCSVSAKRGESQWCMVDVRAVSRMQKPILLSQIKELPELSEMMVIKRGSRLSIQPVTPEEWKFISALGLPKKI